MRERHAVEIVAPRELGGVDTRQFAWRHGRDGAQLGGIKQLALIVFYPPGCHPQTPVAFESNTLTSS
jgi:hypothetical protein